MNDAPFTRKELPRECGLTSAVWPSNHNASRSICRSEPHGRHSSIVAFFHQCDKRPSSEMIRPSSLVSSSGGWPESVSHCAHYSTRPALSGLLTHPTPGCLAAVHPRRAFPRARAFQFSLPLFEGVAKAALDCAQLSHPPNPERAETRSCPRRAPFHRARSASKEGTWPLPSRPCISTSMVKL